MSVTYTHDRDYDRDPFALSPSQPGSASETTRTEAYTPVYARGRARSRKPVRTWMILAPLGAVLLGGTAAYMLMNSDGAARPLAQAPVAPLASLPTPVDVAAPAPLSSAPVEAVPAEAAPVPAPVVRAAVPERRAAPTRREAPAARAPQAASPRIAPAPAPEPLSLAPPPAAAAPRDLNIQTQPLN